MLLCVCVGFEKGAYTNGRTVHDRGVREMCAVQKTSGRRPLTQVRATCLPLAGVLWPPQALPLPTRQAPHMHQARLILSGGLNRHLVGGLYALSHHTPAISACSEGHHRP